MTATLTERYISAVTRSLAPAAQDDVRGELEASIADAIDARTDQGESRTDAERAVLTGLGDPAILAAGYADRPLHLIGPRYFLTWWRLLTLLVWVIPLTAAAGVTIANTLADRPIGEIIGGAIGVGIGAVVHVGFWTTAVFFVLERTGADTGARWTVDSLPQPQHRGTSRGDLIASLVFLGIAAAVLLWDRFIGFVAFSTGGGIDVSRGLGAQVEVMPILHPDLWPWWLGGALVLIGLEAAVAIAVHAGRGWRPALAAANTALALGFAGGAVFLLVTGQLINPAFLELTLHRSNVSVEVDTVVGTILVIVIIAVAVWDIGDGWWKTARQHRGSPSTR